MKGPIVRYFSTTEDTRQKECMLARTMADMSKARSMTEDLVRSFARQGSNKTKEKRTTRARLSKGPLQEVSLSERPLFMKGLPPVQQDLLIRANSIFHFELLQNFHFGLS